MPKVSIIVPVYNVERYLRVCLDSLVGQTLRDVEIILVDDKTPDSSGAICDEYAARDPRIRVIHKQQNQGLGLARNDGLAVATGECVCFVDSDDYVDVRFCEHAYQTLRRDNLDVMRYAYDRFLKEGNLLGNRDFTDDLQVFDTEEDIRQMALCTFFSPIRPGERDLNFGGSAWTVLFRRSLIEDHGLRFVSERELLSEDFIFYYEVLHRARRVGVSAWTPYHYRMNDASVSTRKQPDFPQRVEKFCKHVEELLARDGYDPASQVYAMSYALDILRAKIKPIFMAADLTLAQKRQWMAQQSQNPYYQRIRSEYPLPLLPLKHRLSIQCFADNRFLPLYLMVTLQERVRRLFR